MHFGIDLVELWRGELSIRRVSTLVHRLLGMHGQSALAVAMLGDQARWGNQEYILADLRDSIEAGNYLFLSAHKSDGYTMPDFQVYPRPGLDVSQSVTNPEPEPNWATADDIRNLFKLMHGG